MYACVQGCVLYILEEVLLELLLCDTALQF